MENGASGGGFDGWCLKRCEEKEKGEEEALFIEFVI